jgi:hypothetical protein
MTLTQRQLLARIRPAVAVAVVAGGAVIAIWNQHLPGRSFKEPADAELDPLIDLIRIITATSATTAWGCLGWLIAIGSASLISRAPGTWGRVGEAIALAITPTLLRRLAVTTLGLICGFTVSPTMANATELRRNSPCANASAERHPLTLDWPARKPRKILVVREGDSLWSVTAAELGTGASELEVASRWPEWFTANRALIGPNPELIYPGQILQPPTNATSSTR